MAACLINPVLHSNTRSSTPVRPCRKSRQQLASPEALCYLLKQSQSPKQIHQIHAHILRRGLVGGDNTDPTLHLVLLRLYSYGHLDLAFRVFDLFSDPPTYAWNLMIRANTAAGAPIDSLLLYNRMVAGGVPLDKFTFPFTIRACTAIANAAKGKEVHAFAIKCGFARDTFFLNALISFYFACGLSADARMLFDRMSVRSVVSWTALVSGLVACGDLLAARALFEVMPERNVVSWTVIINGYARSGQPEEAFVLFRQMQKENQKPNAYTIVALLIACTKLGSLSLARWMHDFTRTNGMLKDGPYVGTALVDLYSKCGSISDAIMVFNEMPVRSLATWNSMITSLGVHGRWQEALELFREMLNRKVIPDCITFAGVLCVCARCGMVEEGLKLYRKMKEHYNIEPGLVHKECLAVLLRGSPSLGNVDEVIRVLSSEFGISSQEKIDQVCINPLKLDKGTSPYSVNTEA